MMPAPFATDVYSPHAYNTTYRASYAVPSPSQATNPAVVVPFAGLQGNEQAEVYAYPYASPQFSSRGYPDDEPTPRGGGGGAEQWYDDPVLDLASAPQLAPLPPPSDSPLDYYSPSSGSGQPSPTGPYSPSAATAAGGAYPSLPPTLSSGYPSPVDVGPTTSIPRQRN
eukprot:RCo014721